MKRISTIILLLTIVLSVSAQRLGIMGGFQMTNAYVLAGKCDFNAKPGPGFNFGAIYEMNLSHRLGFDVAVLYNMRHTSYDIDYEFHSDTTVHLSSTHFFLDLPVHLDVNFPIKNSTTMTFFFGPSFNVALHGQDIAWENTDQKKPVGYDTENLYGKDKGTENRYSRFQVSGELGFAVKYKAFEWRASYNTSINNMTNKSYLWYVGLRQGQYKYLRDGNFKVSFAYMFDLRK
ncbi:MAG: PorT family protein [Paludibacteraceae bacterium]|nr:PorT family protein [Paludibacteraceae bacterium]